MPTYRLINKEISQPIEVPRGSRITTTGSGSIEFMPGTAANAQGRPDWKLWPKGASAGFMDTVRPLVIRAVATGALTVVVDEGVNERNGDVVYWSEDSQGFSPVNQPIPFAATVTPNVHAGGNAIVGTLTGNITIAAPLNPSIGKVITFNYVSDATAGRTITYDPVFKRTAVPASTAGGKANHTFTYDGTHWVESGSPLVWL